MRKLLLPVCFALFATAAFAQRPSTLSMTCGEAAALVASAGSIVLSTGRHTYDRFVVGPQFCFLGEHAWPASVPTLDARRCRLGYKCKPGRHPFDDFFMEGFR
jgi:hypothetical protein